MHGSNILLFPFACLGPSPELALWYAALAPSGWGRLHTSLVRGQGRFEVVYRSQLLQVTTIPKPSAKVATCSLWPFGTSNSV